METVLWKQELSLPETGRTHKCLMEFDCEAGSACRGNGHRGEQMMFTLHVIG